MSAISLSGEALALEQWGLGNDNKTIDTGRSHRTAPILLSRNHQDRKEKARKKRSKDGGSGVSGGGGGGGGGKINRDRIGEDFKRTDEDRDGKLSRDEWNRRGNFDRLDTNEDGFLSLSEVRIMYAGHDEKSYDWPPEGMPDSESVIDPSAKKDIVGKEALDRDTLCGIGRFRLDDCTPKTSFDRGFFETGLGPVFPKGANCPGIDDYYAMDYTFKRDREAYHGGIDIPVRWGTPMIAAAAGTVVGKYKGESSARGIQIIIRHAPEDTGIPLWIYTMYGHLDQSPDQEVGQRVKVGEILGPTGNSGVSGKTRSQSTTRRPAIHFTIFYSESPKFVDLMENIIPVDGWWMDPNAVYRQKLPLDSDSMKALPDEEKGVVIPVMFEDAKTSPAAAKLVWPYTCKRD
ncbi:MAG: peptidoglycan DD-metalloendopeptidase family protein [Proteobacteria bacterium]|nr:peptidoglycan DD-metalloendopeptidase family protein [Pseudomonadota bacterium]